MKRFCILIMFLLFLFGCSYETIKIKFIGFYKDFDCTYGRTYYTFNFKIISSNKHNELITDGLCLNSFDKETIEYYKNKIGSDFVINDYIYWQSYSNLIGRIGLERKESYGE